jgi:uroporphyrinogen-III decarboxylase
MKDKEINNLINEFIGYIESDKNQEKKKFWSTEDQVAKDIYSRQAPKNLDEIDRIPVTAGPLNSLFANIFSFSLKDLYNNPKIWLKNYLKNYLYRFKNIPDDLYYDKELPLYLGPQLPWTLYGLKSMYFDNREPELVKIKPLLEKKDDLRKIEMPDFYESGIMPLIHKMFKDVNELLIGKIKLIFPGYNRGPFGIALILRGMQNFLLDMRMDPDFTHQLMAFLTDSRIKWEKEKALFLKEKIKKIDLWNDEVAIPTLSPKFYREFILPYEREISNFPGVGYWHSCGDTTLLAKDISTLKDLTMYHISSWTNLEKAMFDASNLKIEFGLNPQKYIQDANETEIISKVTETMEICRKIKPKAFYILLNGLDVMGNWEDNLRKLKYWHNVIKELGKL